jgi:hypothetical protein
MRCKNIGVKFTVPIPINKPDGNGIIYTEEAILNSINTYKGKPIIDKTGDSDVVVGVVTNADYIKGWDKVRLDGMLFYGGTDCNVIKSHRNEEGILVIDDLDITAFGITK